MPYILNLFSHEFFYCGLFAVVRFLYHNSRRELFMGVKFRSENWDCDRSAFEDT